MSVTLGMLIAMEAMSRAWQSTTDVGAVIKLVDEENGWLLIQEVLKNLNNSIVKH